MKGALIMGAHMGQDGRVPTTVAIVLTPPDTEAARGALRAYLTDIVGRYFGRTATPEEVDAALADAAPDEPHLAPPHGLFWLARDGQEVLGCAGVRFTGDGIGLVTRVWVASAARRRGIASALLNTLENAAREHGLTRLRLDTRSDLVEARALYAHHGFTEIPAFNDVPDTDHWFGKDLT
jgi:ribosomal protein S18 acetylase RimI-like enzyme